MLILSACTQQHTEFHYHIPTIHLCVFARFCQVQNCFGSPLGLRRAGVRSYCSRSEIHYVKRNFFITYRRKSASDIWYIQEQVHSTLSEPSEPVCSGEKDPRTLNTSGILPLLEFAFNNLLCSCIKKTDIRDDLCPAVSEPVRPVQVSDPTLGQPSATSR
jgi:hypothetical protein